MQRGFCPIKIKTEMEKYLFNFVLVLNILNNYDSYGMMTFV